jgi:hypothetical protein
MTRMAGVLLAGLTVCAVTVAPVEARSRAGKAGLWTAVGAGAGFGVGMFVGLTAFDDAINSDRKVWTAAVAGAAAGGALGYFLGRGRMKGGASPTRTPSPLTDRDVAALARTVALRGRPASVVQFADAHASARPF